MNKGDKIYIGFLVFLVIVFITIGCIFGYYNKKNVETQEEFKKINNVVDDIMQDYSFTRQFTYEKFYKDGGNYYLVKLYGANYTYTYLVELDSGLWEEWERVKNDK